MTGPYTPNPNDPTRPLNDDEVQYGAEELRKLKGKVNGIFTCTQITASTYTLLSTDLGNMVRMVNSGTVTIPLGLDSGLIGITGTGQAQIAAVPGVTIQCSTALQPKLYDNNSFAVLMRTAANTWLVAGNLAAAAVI